MGPAPVSSIHTEEAEEPAAADTTPDEVEQELTWIEIELIDDDENPLGDALNPFGRTNARAAVFLDDECHEHESLGVGRHRSDAESKQELSFRSRSRSGASGSGG